ncbi:LAME_0E07558g1_1 [Lachancea meyersii CBS 8951]|uniref:LAME_0E07558g1_1 n=1 Tax=Lachancea meyersii CBS 8951 TaxID=1266667 RepID=A0A1G4JIG5_9SACH|nr:LAME_0E07558g1_1 [Lachancea meyersii CBS 8951]
MQVNLTLPLKWAQCWGYAMILVLVNFLLIFPLSSFLFHDFYSRMIPPDSIQTVPFSESRREMGSWAGKSSFQFEFERVSSETAVLPEIHANGFSQKIPLRADIPYNMNIDLDVYCLNKVTDLNIKDGELTISVCRAGIGGITVFRKTLLLSCANTRDIPNMGGNGRLATSFAQQVQKELVNFFHLENPIFLEHDMKRLEITLKFAGNANVIIDPNLSALTFSMNFDHSLRNLMVRWKRLAYVFGTLIFNAIISFFFLTAFAVTFFRAGHSRSHKPV